MPLFETGLQANRPSAVERGLTHHEGNLGVAIALSLVRRLLLQSSLVWLRARGHSGQEEGEKEAEESAPLHI